MALASEFPFPEQIPPYFHKDYTEVYRWGGGGNWVSQGETIYLAFTVRPKGTLEYYSLGYGIYVKPIPSVSEGGYEPGGDFVNPGGVFSDVYRLSDQENYWGPLGKELHGPVWTLGGLIREDYKDYRSVQFLTAPFVSSRTFSSDAITWYGFEYYTSVDDLPDPRNQFLGNLWGITHGGVAYVSESSYHEIGTVLLYVAPMIAPEPMELDYWELATPQCTTPEKRYSYFIHPPQDESFLAIAHLKPATQATVKIQPVLNSIYSLAVTIYDSYEDHSAHIKTEETVNGGAKEFNVTKGCRVQIGMPRNEKPRFSFLGCRVTIKQRQEYSPGEIEETQFIPYTFRSWRHYGVLDIIIHGDTTITPVTAPTSLIYDPSTGGLVYSPMEGNYLIRVGTTIF